MSEVATTLLDQLMKLPEMDRLLISEHLWLSVSEERQQELLAETTDDPEFQAELERRLESVANGTAELLEPDDVFAQLREHLRRKRQQ